MYIMQTLKIILKRRMTGSKVRPDVVCVVQIAKLERKKHFNHEFFKSCVSA
jgi:hypothetical protein